MDDEELGDLATGLHSSAVRLLRKLRREDDGSGLSAPRLSALSVVVFGGPLSLAQLAAAEQVRPPTMTRIVDALVRDGLVTRETDPADRRMVRITATNSAHTLLELGRRRRVRALTERLKRLPPREREAIAQALEPKEKLTR